jgi:hypothetical protein
MHQQAAGSFAAGKTPLLGAAAADVLLDGVKFGGALKRFADNGRRAKGGDVL